MPSTEKTLHIALNKWAGSDKPKKDDFNEDNAKIDRAVGSIAQTIESLTGAQTTAGETIISHIANQIAHVTAEERAKWGTVSGFSIGTYTGNDALTRKITLGKKPTLGFIFAVGKAPSHVNYSMGQHDTYFAFFSSLGCSLGLSVVSDGFSVINDLYGAPDGSAMRYNQNGVVYVYAYSC